MSKPESKLLAEIYSVLAKAKYFDDHIVTEYTETAEKLHKNYLSAELQLLQKIENGQTFKEQVQQLPEYLQVRALVYALSRRHYTNAEDLEKDFEQALEVAGEQVPSSLLVFVYTQTLMAQ